METPRNISGSQLQKLRLEQSISQTELAASCQRKGWDITRYVIAKIESRSRCVSDFELMLLAEILGVSVSALLPNQKLWQASRKHFMAQKP